MSKTMPRKTIDSKEIFNLVLKIFVKVLSFTWRMEIILLMFESLQILYGTSLITIGKWIKML